MSRPPTKICGICQCRFGDSNCVHFGDHQGTEDDPFIPEPVISPNSRNMVEKGPAGLGAFLEPIFIDPPACHVYSTIDATIAWDAAQVLFFNEERYDTDSMHDKENESSRITFKTPGEYLVTLNLRWSKTNDATATGDLAAFIRLDGANIVAIDSFPVPGADSFAKHSMSKKIAVIAGQYVEVLAKQDVLIDDVKQAMRITTERQSPILSVVFLRTLEGMDVLGIPESVI